MSSIKRGRNTSRIHPNDRSISGEFRSEPCPGSVAAIMEFAPMSLAQREQMVDELDVQRGGPQSSPLLHWYRVHPDGIRVIEIWPSRSAFTSFLEGTVQPLVDELGLPEPHVTCHDVPRVTHHV